MSTCAWPNLLNSYMQNPQLQNQPSLFPIHHSLRKIKFRSRIPDKMWSSIWWQMLDFWQNVEKIFWKKLGEICLSQWNNVELYEGFTSAIQPPWREKKEKKKMKIWNNETMNQRSVIRIRGLRASYPFAGLNMLSLQGLVHILQSSEL